MTTEVAFFIVSAIFIAFMAFLLYDRHATFRRQQEQVQYVMDFHNQESERWQKERAELLDRLQSENFREYKTQQIRMTRAQSKAEPEYPPLELL